MGLVVELVGVVVLEEGLVPSSVVPEPQAASMDAHITRDRTRAKILIICFFMFVSSIGVMVSL